MMQKTSCCSVHNLGQWLLVIGGINWGLIGAFQFDLVDGVFGAWPWLVRLVYILVGLSAVAMLFQAGCDGCKKCSAKM